MFGHESNIKRHARQGLTSGQLKERNSVWRMFFYAVLGGIALGMLGNLILPSFVVGFAFVGVLCGIGLASAIDEKIKREDFASVEGRKLQLARRREADIEARIEAARQNGDFDRWEKTE